MNTAYMMNDLLRRTRVTPDGRAVVHVPSGLAEVFASAMASEFDSRYVAFVCHSGERLPDDGRTPAQRYEMMKKS